MWPIKKIRVTCFPCWNKFNLPLLRNIPSNFIFFNTQERALGYDRVRYIKKSSTEIHLIVRKNYLLYLIEPKLSHFLLFEDAHAVEYFFIFF